MGNVRVRGFSTATFDGPTKCEQGMHWRAKSLTMSLRNNQYLRQAGNADDPDHVDKYGFLTARGRDGGRAGEKVEVALTAPARKAPRARKTGRSFMIGPDRDRRAK